MDAEEEHQSIWSSFRNSVRQKTLDSNSQHPILPLPQILLRQRLAWMRRNKESKKTKQIKLKLITNVNEEKNDSLSIESSPPESESSHTHRAPPSFLFQKPSVRFHVSYYLFKYFNINL